MAEKELDLQLLQCMRNLAYCANVQNSRIRGKKSYVLDETERNNMCGGFPESGPDRSLAAASSSGAPSPPPPPASGQRGGGKHAVSQAKTTC